MKFILKVFFAAVAASVLAVAAKFFLSHKFPNANRGLYGACQMRHIDNLFIGSSMFRMGIDIGIIEEFLGENSYVLAYNGNQPVSILLELESLLKRGVKIRNLYIDMYVFSLFSKPSLSDTLLIWDLTPEESIKLFKILAKDRGDKLKFAYSYFVSSNMQYFFTYPVSDALISARYRKGATTSAVIAEGMTPQKAEALNLGYVNDAPKKPDPKQTDAVLKIVKLASDNKIKLAFVDTIKYAPIYGSRKYAAMISSYSALLDKVHAEYLRFSDSKFENNCENFTDGIHLSGKGKLEFTRILCERILKNQNQ